MSMAAIAFVKFEEILAAQGFEFNARYFTCKIARPVRFA